MTTPPVLAADVGGTQMRAALVAQRGDVLLRRSAATPDHADVPAALIDLISGRRRRARSRHGVACGRRPARVASTTRTGGCCGRRTCPRAGRDLLSRDELVGAPGPARAHRQRRRPRRGGRGRVRRRRGDRRRRLPHDLDGHRGRRRPRRPPAARDGGRWPRSATPSSTGAPGRRGRPARSRSWGRAVAWRAWPTRPGSGARDAREVEAAAAGGDARAIAIWQGAIAACAVGRVEPRHVLLPEHRGHRGRARTAGGVLRPRP